MYKKSNVRVVKEKKWTLHGQCATLCREIIFWAQNIKF